jgi:hypothetical protein
LKEQTNTIPLLINLKTFIIVKGKNEEKRSYKFRTKKNIFPSRTTLLSEPVLGGKKIDLHKLYQEVLAAGGFDQVRAEPLFCL